MTCRTTQLCLSRLSVIAIQIVFTGVLPPAIAFEDRDASVRSDEEYVPAGGPFEVATIEEMRLTDAKRNKEIALRIRFPKTDQSVPVIIFSHGYTYDNTVFAGLSEYWAQHGYVVIHPTHIDARVLTKKSGKRVRMDDPATWRDRVKDVLFVIDSLAEIQRNMSRFDGELDRARLGVGGHSFGAYTSMLIGGTTVLMPGQDKPVSFASDRVRAILPIAGQGRGQQGLHDHSWDNVKLPMMMITGTRDRGLNKEEPRWRAEGFEFSPPGNKYWAFVKAASHFSYDGGAGSNAQNRISAVVKTASIAFWDACLRDTNAAREYLSSMQLQNDHSGDVEFFRR